MINLNFSLEYESNAFPLGKTNGVLLLYALIELKKKFMVNYNK